MNQRVSFFLVVSVCFGFQVVIIKYLRICFAFNSYFLTLFNILLVTFKVGLSPSKKNCVICFIERPLTMMKNGFYFILKALFVLKIFKFLSTLHVGKTA